MPIKNYTTKIDCYQSIGEIQGVLARNGAKKIMIDYGDNGQHIGIAIIRHCLIILTEDTKHPSLTDIQSESVRCK